MPISRATFSTDGRIRPFSTEFARAMRQIVESCASWDEARSAIMAKVMEPGAPRSGISASSSEFTWAAINATYSGSFVTGVAPTDLGNGIFEYRAVPVRITGYSAGVFTYDIQDDPRFSPSAYEGSSVMLLNAPTHANTADWKYAGVSTGAGSSYPAGYDVMGIGQDHVTGEWKSPLVLIQKLVIDQDTTLWMLAAEPDHDGSCTPTDTSGSSGTTAATDFGLSTAILNGNF